MKNTERVTVSLDLKTAKMLEDYANGRRMSISKYTTLALERMFAFDDEIRAQVSLVDKTPRRTRTGISMEDSWKETKDETALLLRKAHDNDVSFGRISDLSGVGRRYLYFYVSEERKCPESHRVAIKAAVETLMAEKAASEN